MHRTQSEEPPKSPFDTNETSEKPSFIHFDAQSRASSHQSDLETSRSDQRSVEYFMPPTRNMSQDSATSFRSMDMTTQDSISMMFGHAASRKSSHTGCTEVASTEGQRSFESNSLPRRKCVYHNGEYEYQTNSLPRKDTANQLRNMYNQSEATEVDSFDLPQLRTHGTFSLESTMECNHLTVDPIQRRYSCGVQESAYQRYINIDDDDVRVLRRNSTSNFHRPTQQSDDEDEESGSDEYCSTCESEDSDSRQEKEIFIDFKPRLSPTPSPRSRRKRLQKAMSEGEILFDKRQEVGIEEIPVTSASEEDVKNKENGRNGSYLYSNVPIKDEGVYVKKNLLKLPDERDNVKVRREAFRKRSISLEEPNGDEEDAIKLVKSGPPSPCLDDKTEKNISTFPSSDSLATDLTRDHSDGIWNESQATVLQIEPR